MHATSVAGSPASSREELDENLSYGTNSNVVPWKSSHQIHGHRRPTSVPVSLGRKRSLHQSSATSLTKGSNKADKHSNNNHGRRGTRVLEVCGAQSSHLKPLLQVLENQGWVRNLSRGAQGGSRLPSALSLRSCTLFLTVENLPSSHLLTRNRHLFHNHFERNSEITTKQSLAQNLQNLRWNHGVNAHHLFPRCYTLHDEAGKLNFRDDYRQTSAASLLRSIVEVGDDALRNVDDHTLRMALHICDERVGRLVGQVARARRFSDSEWDRLLSASLHIATLESDSATTQRIAGADAEKGSLLAKAQQLVNQLARLDPQWSLNGRRNIWIVKPGDKSKAAAIFLHNDLSLIEAHATRMGGARIVQKYIENPQLGPGHRKFDLRVWVLVTSWEPLEAWIYEPFYCRVCRDTFSLAQSSFERKSVHLCNASIQGPGSILTMDDLITHLRCEGLIADQQALDHFISSIHRACRLALQAGVHKVTPRDRSFEVYGVDLLLDEELTCWLLEVNLSPGFGKHGEVFSNMVKSMFEGVHEIVFNRQNDGVHSAYDLGWRLLQSSLFIDHQCKGPGPDKVSNNRYNPSSEKDTYSSHKKLRNHGIHQNTHFETPSRPETDNDDLYSFDDVKCHPYVDTGLESAFGPFTPYHASDSNSYAKSVQVQMEREYPSSQFVTPGIRLLLQGRRMPRRQMSRLDLIFRHAQALETISRFMTYCKKVWPFIKELRELASIKITKTCRLFLACRLVQAIRRREKAALKLQCLMRMAAAKVVLSNRIYARYVTCASFIQKWWRKRTLQYRQSIQRICLHSWIARNKVTVKAAGRLQGFWRARKCVRLIRSSVQTHRALKQLQAIVKAWLVKHQAQQTLSWKRMHASRVSIMRNMLTRHQAATLIANSWAIYKSRRFKAATLIQRFWRINTSNRRERATSCIIKWWRRQKHLSSLKASLALFHARYGRLMHARRRRASATIRDFVHEFVILRQPSRCQIIVYESPETQQQNVLTNAITKSRQQERKKRAHARAQRERSKRLSQNRPSMKLPTSRKMKLQRAENSNKNSKPKLESDKTARLLRSLDTQPKTSTRAKGNQRSYTNQVVNGLPKPRSKKTNVTRTKIDTYRAREEELCVQLWRHSTQRPQLPDPLNLDL